MVKKPTAQVNNLYKIRKRKDTDFNAVKKKTPVGRKKAPNWKKICFQLDKFFFPTGNLVFGVIGFLKPNLQFSPFKASEKW